MANSTVVAIPARDEAERIEPCLNALKQQTHLPDCVVLLLNNCSDRTAKIASTLAPGLPFRLDVCHRDLPKATANAGHARRLAMAMAAALAGSDGILMTTDADAVVPPDWVSANRAALRQGIDVVCGRALIDPLEAENIPSHLHADDALECRLIQLLDEIAWTLDPEPHDPPPRHTEASGASIAVRAEAFHRVGGIPAVPSGEDRAFVRALWMIDARVRHEPSIRVTVSGRIVGRAPGGMADAIRRRMGQQDEFCDDQVEPATDALRRYRLRARARGAWAGKSDRMLAADLGISREMLTHHLAQPFFGAAWAGLEVASPVLKRRRVRFVDLPKEILFVETILRRLAYPEILAAD